jgi:uncharacterized protein YqeY
MTTKREILSQAIKDAMRAKDPGLDTLRMVQSEVRLLEIESGNRDVPLDDTAFEAVIRRLVKKREESITMYKQGNRQDLVDKESAEISVLKRFLPAEISDAELKTILQPLIQANPGKPGGQLMKDAMPLVKGAATGNRVKAILEELTKA